MTRYNTTIDVTVHAVSRLNSSVNGNPRFQLSTDGGLFTTQSDGSVGYDIQNLNLPGKRATLELTPAGRVVLVTVLGFSPDFNAR